MSTRTSDSHTAARRRLDRHRGILSRKPILRTLYSEWYAQIRAGLAPGLTIEVGSGPASLKESCPDVVTTDVVWCPWLDLTMDAQALALLDHSVSNIVLCDVLHHLKAPGSFFREAARVLRKSGRIVLLDPYISPFSRIVNALFHEEPVDLTVDPLSLQANGTSTGEDPFHANQAFATVLFWRDLGRTMDRLPEFKLVSRSRTGFLRYPLSGGFGHHSLIPGWAFAYLEPVDRWVAGLAWLIAFRTMVVLERV